MVVYPYVQNSRFLRIILLFLILLFSKNGFSQTFGTPVMAVNPYPGTNGSIGAFSKLLVVNGNPAICYYDNSRTAIYYMRASDVDGTAWNAPVLIDMTYTVGQYLSFKIVNGNPAVAYYEGTNGDLKYARAIDADGTAWGAP